MPAGYALGAQAPKKKKPTQPFTMFGAGMQDQQPLEQPQGSTDAFSFGTDEAALAMPPNPNLPGGMQSPMGGGANPFAALLQQLVTGGGAGAQPGGGVDLAGLLRQMQADKDPVGKFNNRSNLPSYAAGSTSPFAMGFFKPMTPSNDPFAALAQRERVGNQAPPAFPGGNPQTSALDNFNPGLTTLNIAGPDGVPVGKEVLGPKGIGTSTFPKPATPQKKRRPGVPY